MNPTLDIWRCSAGITYVWGPIRVTACEMPILMSAMAWRQWHWVP